MPDPRTTARDILLRVDAERAWAGPLLDSAADTFDDPRDAALARELVLGVLRWRRLLDRVLGAFSKRPLHRLDAEVLTVLRIGAYSLLKLDRVPDFAAVDRAVDSVKRGPKRSAAGYVNAVLRNVARSGGDLLPPEPAGGDVEALALSTSHPGWWVKRLTQRVGWEQATLVLAESNNPAGVTLRANPLKTTVADLADSLAAQGREIGEARLVPGALRLLSGGTPGLEPLRDGRAWVQDEASQLVPLLFGQAVEAGGDVVDTCAAPGGKTLMTASSGAARVLACDLRPSRLRRLCENVKRAGFESVQAVAADMTRDYPFRGRFERILVDAPCSGSGTMRRNPEIRWRLQPNDPLRLAALQSRLLERAVEQAAGRATIVYSVCSMEPEEGESVVADFLSRHPGFSVVDARRLLPEAAHRLVDDDGTLRTSPADGVDGFFAVRLDRGL